MAKILINRLWKSILQRKLLKIKRMLKMHKNLEEVLLLKDVQCVSNFDSIRKIMLDK